MREIRREDVAVWTSRFAKHLILLVATVATIFLLFVTYTTYAFRRNIDERIASIDKDQTVETIVYNTFALSDQLKELENLRCAQRDAIAFFRLSAYPFRVQLNEFYAKTWDLRMEFKRFLEKHPDVDQKKLEEAYSDIWSLPLQREVPLKNDLPAERQSAFNRDFAAKLGEIAAKLDKAIRDEGSENLARLLGWSGQSSGQIPLGIDSIGQLEDAMRRLASADAKIFQTTAVDGLESRIATLKAESAKQIEALDKWKGITTQKWVVESVFLNQVSKEGLAQRMPADPRTRGQALGAIDCDDSARDILRYAAHRLERFVEVTDLATADKEAIRPVIRKIQDAVPTRDQVGAIDDDDRNLQLMTIYLLLPTTMQALVVTILFGVLGGLTVNLLRLSKIGYWGLASEPDWGDVFISPIAGAIAAMIIYLVSATGLPLLTDARSSASAPVSAALVGFLGFVSGFLNREAFAQVKILGLKLFGQKPEGRVGREASEIDVEFADRLGKIGAKRFAELAMLHGIGERLSKSTGLRILVPADAYFEGLPAAEWFAYASPAGRTKFLRLLDDLTLAGASDLRAIADGQAIATASGTQLSAQVDATRSPKLVRLGNAEFDPLQAVSWRGRELVIATAKP